MSEKFKHSDDGFKYFIDYKTGKIVKPLCIILPKMARYIKQFEKYQLPKYPWYDSVYRKITGQKIWKDLIKLFAL